MSGTQNVIIDLGKSIYRAGYRVARLGDSFKILDTTIQDFSEIMANTIVNPDKSIIRKRKRREQWRKRR